VRQILGQVGRAGERSSSLGGGGPASSPPVVGSAAREPSAYHQALSHAADGAGAPARPLMFAYWGRRGAVSQFSLDLARVAAARSDMRCTVSLSRQNEILDAFKFLHDDLYVVDTFEKHYQAFLYYRSLQRLQRCLAQRFANDCTQAFISLVSHLWSPLMASVIRRAGVRHVVVVHDADPHPGDRSTLLNGWLLREAAAADHVITLSESVASQLAAARGVPESKISVLFHPDMNYAGRRLPVGNDDGPLRVLFLGRILPYKGLQVFAEAMARLHRDGVPVQVGVFGEGRIDPPTAATLSALGAEVENRWMRHDEFGGILARYDILVASHTQASQSGVVAMALNAGLPVVASPVGGLVEQITHGVTGVLADAPTAPAFADAVQLVGENRDLLARLRRGIAARREERSMRRFFEKISEIALSGRRSGSRPEIQ
jgi:glycosyltransferase involved in cell wall biosynthesis